MKYRSSLLLNTSISIQGTRHFIHTNTMNNEIQESNIIIKTLAVSTAECEHGFNLINIIPVVGTLLVFCSTLTLQLLSTKK